MLLGIRIRASWCYNNNSDVLRTPYRLSQSRLSLIGNSTNVIIGRGQTSTSQGTEELWNDPYPYLLVAP